MNYSISVIIPYFNNSDTIRITLDSLLHQTTSVYEVIIIDDFSKDHKELLKIVSDYEDELPIQLLRNEKNKKGAYSRNRGIMASSGEVIAFLDADDVWVPNKVTRIIQKISEFGLENLFFSKVKISVSGSIVATRPSHFNPDVHMSEYLFLEDGFIQTSSIFCGAKIAKDILFQENFKRHQDYDFVLRAAHHGVKFHFIDEELAIYSSDMSVNLSKGEAYSYSKWWLDEMQIYFSKNGSAGFRIFNLTARLLAEKRYAKALFNALKGFMNLNIGSYKRIYPKLIRTIREMFKKR